RGAVPVAVATKMRDSPSSRRNKPVGGARHAAAGEPARVHPADTARGMKVPEGFEARRVVPRPVMPIARPERAPAQPSVAPVAEAFPVTVVIPVAIAAVVTASPSEEDHVMRPPAPGETRTDIDDIDALDARRPAPAVAHVSPSPVVIRRPAPRLVRNPRPAVGRKPSPITVAIRRPVCGDSARTPHPAVIGRIDPFAVIVQVVNARNRDRYVT